MKKRRVSLFSFAVLIPPFLITAFLGAFLVYGVWATNRPHDWKVPFPEGTQILEKSDTHQGIFRRKGISVVVAKIPESHIRSYGNRLRRADFASGRPMGMAPELLGNVEAIKDSLDSKNTLYTYRDEAIALIEEPFSDWFAAIYDLDTGIFCYVEYDE